MTPTSRSLPARALILVLCLAGLLEPMAASAAPSVQTRSDLAGPWQLVETWSGRSRPEQPGQVSSIRDIARGPSGRLYVLDADRDRLELFDEAGVPLRSLELFEASDANIWKAQALAVGPGGTIHVLSWSSRVQGTRYASRLDRLTAEGRRSSSLRFHSARPQPYRDLAVDAAGRLLLSRIQPTSLEGEPLDTGGPGPAVELRAPDGRLLARRAPPALGQPGSLTRSAEGRIYVVNRVQPNINLPGGEDPRPASEELPPAEPEEGILIFDAELTLEAFVAFTAAEDIAAGAGDIYVSRGLELYSLGQDLPLLSAPAGNPAAGIGERLFLAGRPEGGLALGIGHCSLQGLAILDDPRAAGDSRWIDIGGAPAGSAPELPVAIAAGQSVALLQGRYDPSREAADVRLVAGPRGSIPQTLQSWSGGQPTGSRGLCSGPGPWRARDVAMDAGARFVMDRVSLRRIDAEPWPTWTRVPLDPGGLGPEPWLVAVDAGGGRLSLIDAARDALILMDDAGGELSRWPIQTGRLLGDDLLPVDLASTETSLLLADRGRRRVVETDLDGRALGSWHLPSPPRRIAAGPAGQAFVLGADGWIYALAPEGRIDSAWPLPDVGAGSQAEAYDLAVDERGRVLVSYARLELDVDAPAAWSLRMPAHPVTAAGVWVYEKREGQPPLAIEATPDACLLRGGARARPERALTGQSIQLEVQLDGHCAARPRPTQLVLLLDRSRSMGFRDSLAMATESLQALLAMLERQEMELALVVFDEKARLLLPLGSEASRFAPALAGIEPDGGTWAESGLEMAGRLLAEAEPGPRQEVLVITDGAFEHPALAEAAAAELRAAGIGVRVLAWVNEAFDPSRQLLPLERVAGGGDRVWFAPLPQRLAELAAALSSLPTEGWIEALEVELPLPAEFEYRPGSAEPGGRYDAAGHRLLWTLGPVGPEQALMLRAEVSAGGPASWPEDLEARLEYRDASGHQGRRGIPAPSLEVLEAAGQLWLPWVRDDDRP